MVCSEVREHELEVTTMTAETSDARTMAMRTTRPERDGEDRGFTVGCSASSIGVGDEWKQRGKALSVRHGRKRMTGR